MSLSSRSVKTPSVKRVSFLDSVQGSFIKESKQDGVEISELFPKIEVKSILRDSVYKQPTMPAMPDEARDFLRKKRRRRERLTHEKRGKARMNALFSPPKEPTETLAHAMLRSMTHKLPSKNSKLILPKIALLSDADRETRFGSPKSRSTGLSFPSHRSLPRFSSLQSLTPRNSSVQTSFDTSIPNPEITTCSAETNVISYDRECGLCKHNWRRTRQPASGFCKLCDEYMCADCIYNHRGRLTRLHPVIVFNCSMCKEMNILNRKGSAYCIKCKQFFCPICVVLHCSTKYHDVLEGDDMLDVTDVMIGK